MPPPILQGDAAFIARERSRRLTSGLMQAGFVLLLLLFLVWLGLNVTDNLQQRQIRAGFQFLLAPAGFNIGESLIDFHPSNSYWLAFIVGLLNTLRAAAAAIVLATILGVVIGLARLSQHPLVRSFAGAWVQLSRNIPLLILLLAIYLVFTELFPDATEPWSLAGLGLFSKEGLQIAAPLYLGVAIWLGLGLGVGAALLGAWWQRRGKLQPSLMRSCMQMLLCFCVGLALAWVLCGMVGGWSHPQVDGLSITGGAALSPEFLALWLGLSFFTSGAIAEIVRAGAQAVPLGQWRAGLALGLTRGETIASIIFPQALRLAIPPLTSQYMSLIKNSSLAVLIGYPDVVSIANTTINQNGQALECILIIMAVYLCINLAVSVVMNFFNARVTSAPR